MCLELEDYKETGYENILANTHIHKITFCETILLETILAFAAYYFLLVKVMIETQIWSTA